MRARCAAGAATRRDTSAAAAWALVPRAGTLLLLLRALLLTWPGADQPVEHLQQGVAQPCRALCQCRAECVGKCDERICRARLPGGLSTEPAEQNSAGEVSLAAVAAQRKSHRRRQTPSGGAAARQCPPGGPTHHQLVLSVRAARPVGHRTAAANQSKGAQMLETIEHSVARGITTKNVVETANALERPACVCDARKKVGHSVGLVGE